jgi:hypothetical protein
VSRLHQLQAAGVFKSLLTSIHWNAQRLGFLCAGFFGDAHSELTVFIVRMHRFGVGITRK